MPEYKSVEEVIPMRGLRLVLVAGTPSPWGQAAKTLFELKGLDYALGAQEAGGANEALEAWSGQTGGPVVAWEDEKPINRWNDILMLAERLAPEPAMLPRDVAERALMFGLSNEICGEQGLAWNRRLEMFAPAMGSDDPPEGMRRMAGNYGYSKAAAEAAGDRMAEVLEALTQQLKSQQAKGSDFLVGKDLTALDIYWTAFSNILQPLPPEKCPLPEESRPFFTTQDPKALAALDPLLLAHRDRIFDEYFRCPMEL